MLGIKVKIMEVGESSLAFFTEEQNVVGGALIKSQGMEPSAQGTIVYLNAGEDLSQFLQKVKPEGGKVVLKKTPIGEFGYIAYFLDTEGNRVALHSMS
jgi:predicted enzyme related to lactoylglutathione lyase